MVELLLDLPAQAARLGLAGQDQGGRQQRLTEHVEQRLHEDVVGDPTPTVRFLGCISRRGTSWVAGRMKV